MQRAQYVSGVCTFVKYQDSIYCDEDCSEKEGKLHGDTFSCQPWTQSETLTEFLSLDSFQFKPSLVFQSQGCEHTAKFKGDSYC